MKIILGKVNIIKRILKEYNRPKIIIQDKQYYLKINIIINQIC